MERFINTLIENITLAAFIIGALVLTIGAISVITYDRDQYKWYVYYDVDTKEFLTDFDLSHMSGKVYFESEEKAIHAYNHNQQLFKELFKVK